MKLFIALILATVLVVACDKDEEPADAGSDTDAPADSSEDAPSDAPSDAAGDGDTPAGDAE